MAPHSKIRPVRIQAMAVTGSHPSNDRPGSFSRERTNVTKQQESTIQSKNKDSIPRRGKDSTVPYSEVALLSPKLFDLFKNLLFEEAGIALTEQKRLMLSVRIAKRLKALGIKKYESYIDYIETSPSRREEIRLLLNVVTTNKTDFFREDYHFDYLRKTILPECDPRLVEQNAPLRIWSAGCSTGEEPYTLAFVLNDFFGGRPNRFQIPATDISTDVLKKAIRAIYPSDDVKPIPTYYRNKYMVKGRGEWEGYWRISPAIRRTVQFGRLNFNDDNYRIAEQMNIIFCRNVIIYFSMETKTRVMKKIGDQLFPRGYLFIGHSETLNNINNEFEPVSRTVYRKL